MIRLRRIWVLFTARNREFFRDRAGFGWNILFPFLIVLGFGLMFRSDTSSPYKLGIFPVSSEMETGELAGSPELAVDPALISIPSVKMVPFRDLETALDRLAHHKIDLLVENSSGKLQYWMNPASPKSRVLEAMVKSTRMDDQTIALQLEKHLVSGSPIRYIDWLFPGILGMNIMFSAFFGVGFVIVRYRKTGVLKRLKATPVTAFEYLFAQLVSRVLILLFTSAVVWLGCDLLFSFQVHGSYLDIFVVFLAGTLCLVSIGLVIACRGTSEEMANGLINFICWPMMFLSEVWFSIEGAAQWIRDFSRLLPLTHFLSAARKIINDGASLSDVTPEILILLLMTLVFLTIGSLLFSWTR